VTILVFTILFGLTREDGMELQVRQRVPGTARKPSALGQLRPANRLVIIKDGRFIRRSRKPASGG
jgi:hypothetical protein